MTAQPLPDDRTLEDHIREVVDRAPKLTDEQRSRLVVLLRKTERATKADAEAA